MILITEFMDTVAVKKLRALYEVTYDITLFKDQESLKNKIGDAKAIIVRNKTLITRNLLESAPNLSCVGRLGVGLDNIDVVACKERNITVYPATGANSNSVAEYVICCAMVLLRRAFFTKNEILSGGWPREESSGHEVNGKTMGLIGFGEIAQRTRSIAASLGMQTVAYDPYIDSHDSQWDGTRNLTFDEVLKCSDVVSLHVPLTKETTQLVDEEKLRLMKSSAIIINAARGGVIDEYALVRALEKGWISGAALDVFSDEPLQKENAEKFKNLNNIILTPHIAGITKESTERVSHMIADEVNRHLSNI